MKIGLSLCGGGSKGAYELGAWDAFRELGMKFNIVTGSSIGCLNGSMYVQNEYDICNELWNSVKIGNVIEDGFDIDEMNIKSIVSNNEFRGFFKKYVKEAGCNVTPFKELLYKYLDFDLIRNSDILFGLTVSSFPLMKKEEILLNNLSNEDMYQYIVASCSMFPFFPIVKIHGKQYIDGGFSDNLPIEFAFKLGASKVVAIDLSHKITHKEFLNNPYVDYIYPKFDLGSFLHFNPEVISNNRLIGYYDTMKFYNKLQGFKYTFKLDQSYQSVAKTVTLNILNDNITFTNNSMKSYVKKSCYKDLFQYLNMYIHRRVTDYDYFLKSLEELCEIFDLSIYEVHDISDVIKYIKSEMNKYTESKIMEEYFILKSDYKKREFINTCNKKEFLSQLYSQEGSSLFRILLLQINIELYLSVVLLEALGF